MGVAVYLARILVRIAALELSEVVEVVFQHLEIISMYCSFSGCQKLKEDIFEIQTWKYQEYVMLDTNNQ